MPDCPNCKAEYDEGFQVCADCKVPLEEGAPDGGRLRQTPEVGKMMDKTFLMNAADKGQSAMVVEVLADNGISSYVLGRESGDPMNVLMGYSVYGEDIFVDKADLERARELTAGMLGGAELLEEAGEEEEDAPQTKRRARAWVFAVPLLGGIMLLIAGILVFWSHH